MNIRLINPLTSHQFRRRGRRAGRKKVKNLTENIEENDEEMPTKVDLGSIKIAPQEFAGENLILSLVNPMGTTQNYRITRMNISQHYKDENGRDCGGNLVVYVDNEETGIDDRFILKSEWKMASNFVTTFNRFIRKELPKLGYFSDGSSKDFNMIKESVNSEIKIMNLMFFVEFKHEEKEGKHGKYSQRSIRFYTE